MGYSTKFQGHFNFDKPLTVPQFNQLKQFADEDHRNESGMPGYYCKWEPTEDGQGLEWNGQEKFYDYAEWLAYLITTFLIPWGITVNGEVPWQGEEVGDVGVLMVKNNEVSTQAYIPDNPIPICEICHFSYDIREPHLHKS